MKNLDKIKQEQEAFRQKLAATVKTGGADEIAQVFGEFAQSIEHSILTDARELMQCADTTVLAARGVRQLTSEEHTYYQKVIEAMRSPVPKQALSELDVVMPKTTVDAVFDDLVDKHPLLDAIRFQNTSGLIEMLVNTGTRQLATWSPLTSEITKELTSGFKKVNMGLHKLSAFLPVARAMLDLGPAWLDRYVRAILQESLSLGLEEAVINGTGKDMPIGMNRKVGEGVTVTDGVYPVKETVPLTSLDPAAYGALLAGMSKTPNGHYRAVESVLLLVNPNDYLTKIMPATTVRAASGSYVGDVFPFPTRVIQSVQIPENRAILGLGDRYFLGVGAAASGRLEYSDEYRFLEDERVYLIKTYAHGEPLDNNAFVYADISGLEPAVHTVTVNEARGAARAKA